ncbi:protein kinase C delta type-like [Xenopus laevis]|uniref:Protein kinase C delta type-like n=1 Tax=Xenopus laevis TaxID=8355 RepID=A0A8J1M2S5_XENLA|nr:protein kinase C delta type-like [Xenopus laevis]
MVEELPPAMEKSTPPIRSEEKELFAATNAEMEKKDSIRMKRMMDNNPGRANGKKRKKRNKKRKHLCSGNSKVEEKKEVRRKRHRSGEDSIKAEEAGSNQKRLHQEVPLPVAVSMCQIHAELGSGSFGKVMLASLPNNRQHVAIKVIQKSDKVQLNEIVTEANVLKMAAGCPHLCHAYGSFLTQRHAVFVMEYVSGGNMDDQIDIAGALEMDSIRFYAAEMVCALQFLHSNGIIHRDLKPGNVLVTSEGHVKIADFGLAVEGIYGYRKARGRRGTLPYMAPEVIEGQAYDAGIDWWSLGILIYEMATGDHPLYSGNDVSEFIEAIKYNKPRIPYWFSEELQDLLQQLLMKNPDERLGCNGNIREHPFFHSIDWVQLEKLNVPPPSKPKEVPSVDFSKTYEEPLTFLESIKYNISSRYVPPASPLEQPSHFWTSRNICPPQAQALVSNYPYHQAPLSAQFGPFGFPNQPYTAYRPNLGYYQRPLPLIPVPSPYYHQPVFSPVIRPPLVPFFPDSHHHNQPLNVFNTPWPFPSPLQ